MRCFLRNGWLGLALLAVFVAVPAAGQSPQAQARALSREVARHRKLQQFDRATLPLYRRAVRLDRLAGLDTLLAAHAYYAGITYFNLERFDSAAALLRQSVQVHLRLGQVAYAVDAAGYLSSAYSRQGQPDSMRAVRRRLEALYARTRPGTRERTALDDCLAVYYQDEGQYARSLRHRLAIVAYRRARLDTANLGVALVNVGELFYLQNQYRQALAYRYEGLRWLRLDPTMSGTLPALYGMIGKTYRDMGRLDSARLLYTQALRLPATLADPDAAGYLHSELSVVLSRQGQLALARHHSQLALARLAHSADLDGRTEALYYAGELEVRARNYPAARAYLRQAQALTRRVQNKDKYEPIARMLAQAEAGVGNYAEAYRLRGLAADLLDSAHAAVGQRAMAEMEARFQNRDKQRQIGVLNAENLLRAAEAASQRRATYLALTGVAGLLLVLGLIGFLLRQRQRTAALLATQNDALAALNERLNGSNAQLAAANQTKAKLFSIVSHDLRAPVSNLFQLLELSRRAPHLLDEATRQQQTEHLRQSARDLLDTMEELLAWSKDQLEGLDPVPEPLALAPVLAELAALYLPLAERKNIALTANCPPDLHLVTDPNFLRVILRNLVQNAIKFTPDGGRVSLVAEAGPAGRTTVRVADSGPGFSPAQLAQLLTPDGATPANAPAPTDPTHGLGLRLTREFVAKLGGELRATSVPGVGSEVAVAL